MPKWTEYTSKDTLADNDEVMLYDATGKANKRGLMSKFWDYVVDKMATAVISKLETDNKTIIGAINALNGNSLTHAKRIAINPLNGESFLLDDASSYLICYSGIDVNNIKNIGFAVALSRASKEKTGGILSIKSELTGINFVLDGNTLKVSTKVWIVMTLTKI